jgi:hypothetical protein
MTKSYKKARNTLLRENILSRTQVTPLVKAEYKRVAK